MLASHAVGHSNNPESIRITPTEDRPWTSAVIDFYGLIPQSNQHLLVVMNTYSKFLEVEIVYSTDAKTCIPKLDTNFARHGIPPKIETDNDPLSMGKNLKDILTPLVSIGQLLHQHGHKLIPS